MTLLRESFIALQCFGLWPSPKWTYDSVKTRTYYVHTGVVLMMIYMFTLSELFSVFMSTIDDVEEFSDNCFMLLTMMAVCVKAVLILRYKFNIRDVLVALGNYPHAPLNKEELLIQENFDKKIRRFTVLYGALTEVTVWTMSISTFFQGIPFGVLPYKAWLPYDYSTPKLYWLTYCVQLIAVIFGANINIGFDTVIPGFFMQICAQLNLLKCRLTRTINEIADDMKWKEGKTRTIHEQRIIACVKYHRNIFEISEKINSIFTSIIFIQYSASSIIICVSIYMISQMPLFSPKFMSIFMYLSCMLMQIFMLCATGNEATIQCESLTASIYNSQWYVLDIRMKKYLGLVMMRALKPLIFKSGYIIILSLNSFRNLLKLSYSAYTVLQRSSQ